MLDINFYRKFDDVLDDIKKEKFKQGKTVVRR